MTNGTPPAEKYSIPLKRTNILIFQASRLLVGCIRDVKLEMMTTVGFYPRRRGFCLMGTR